MLSLPPELTSYYDLDLNKLYKMNKELEIGINLTQTVMFTSYLSKSYVKTFWHFLQKKL